MYSITKADLQAGEQGIVTSAVITNKKTGEAPFDLEEGAGNDISQTDDIVRSFDRVSWTIETTMALKEGATLPSANGGYLNIEVTLPESCAGKVNWDTESMAWTGGTANISQDGRVFSAKYHMNDDEVTIPGKQTVELVLKVLGAENGLEINPKINLWIEGNLDNEKYSLTDTGIVRVSAAPNYNITLKRSNHLAANTTLNFDGEDKEGKIYGYGVVLQLYNSDEAKGIKGIEIPKDDINFDIDLKLERTINGTSELEDITDVCTPLLWNYKVNNREVTGNIPNREMQFGNTSTLYARGIAPLGMATSNREESVYNSGNIQMSQNNGVINTTINNYAFDGIFPKYCFTYSGHVHPNIDYTDNIGCFSAGYFQVFVPFNEESTIESEKYYLTVSDNNMNINSLSGQNLTTQALDTDDSVKIEVKQETTGTYGQCLFLSNSSDNKVLSTDIYTGDAFACIGQKIFATTKLELGSANVSDIYTANKLIKFDADAVEPILNDDGSKYSTRAFDGTMSFKTVYLCKKDGTNWSNQDEMNNANIEDLDWYENISDIPEGKNCVGVYLESITGNLAVSSGGNNLVNIPLKVKNTATIGNVYGFSEKTQMWKESLDRGIYTIDNIGNFTYPTPAYDSGNLNYIKSEYDDEGNYLKNNTSNGGTSLLIVGAEQSLNLESLDDSNNSKEVFDLGRNESEVTYKITPSLTTSYINDKISGVTVTLTDTLPDGLTYIPDSTLEYGEPDITSNSDGTTKLVWKIYNCEVGKEIKPLVFKAKINEEAENSKKYTNKVVIKSDNEKVGNPRVESRTITNTIQVVNLASHRLYKEVDTPVIEKNGNIIYTLTYLNKTDSNLPDFQIIDILPYNNDSRGTSYNGTFRLDHIDIVQTVSGTQVSNDNLELYTTNSADARNLNAKDESIGVSSIWNSKNIGENINEEATSFAVKGNVNPNSKIEIKVHIKTQDNMGGDSYINIASAQTDKNTDPIQTTAVGAKVISRKISGMVWYDVNENGIMDNDESYSNNIGVVLKDTNGNEIASTNTNESGYYEFNSLSRNQYVVEIRTDSKYKLTTQNVGENSTINSKFEEINGVKQSGIITKLDSTATSNLVQEYENAGLVVKDAKVLVKYLDLNDNELTYTTVGDDGNDVQKSYSYEVNGKVGENYTTDKKDIPEYLYVRNSNNTNGVFTESPIEVKYYYEYNKQDIKVKKIWADNNNEANKRPSSIILELYANGTLKDSYKVIDTSENTCEHIFSNLPKYDNEGRLIQYTVDEKEVNEGDLKFYEKSIDNNNQTITDTFNVPDEKINVKLNLNWDDNNNNAQKRPASVKLELYANGTLNTVYVINTNSNLYEHTFESLPKYDELGNEIIYTIDESEVENDDLAFYTKKIDSTTNTITNKFTVPDEKTNVTVTVNWNDNNNINGARPQSIKLYIKNNDVAIQEYTLPNTTSNSQTHEFTNLPKYDDLGNEITYTADIDNITGYDKSVSGTIIQNTIKSYDIATKVEGDGGKISGQNETVYESVTYYGTSTKEIKITPDYGYKISSITINGDNIDFIPNQDGTYELNRFENVTENKNVVVTFEKKDSRVVVRYVNSKGEDIIPKEVIEGKVGDSYSSNAKEFSDYDLKLTPDNANGVMTEEPIVVKYEYSLVNGSITIKLVDKDDETKILSGAKFKIEKLNEDGSTDDTFIAIEDVTGEDGIVKFENLLIGKYKVTQLETISDYQMDGKTFEIQISKDERDINITAQNEHKSELLQTVNTGDILIAIVAMILICITVFGITLVKFKSKKN